MPMFWMYLALFLLSVLVPFAITRGYGFLPEESAEAAVLFGIGFCGFLLYALREKHLVAFLKEKMRLQKVSTQTSQDLSASYTYIGEMNRKVDILKNALSLVSVSPQTKKEERALFTPLIDALYALIQTQSFLVRIVDITEEKTLKEFHGTQSFMPHIQNKNLCVLHTHDIANGLYHTDEYTIIAPRQLIDGIGIFFVTPQNERVLEDRLFLKIICKQILSLFVITQQKKEPLIPLQENER